MLQHRNDDDVLLKAINLVAFFIPALLRLRLH